MNYKLQFHTLFDRPARVLPRTLVILIAGYFLTTSLSAGIPQQVQLFSSVQWEYAQFVSRDNLYQWIEKDMLVTAESQLTLLKRMGQDPSVQEEYINDLVVLNFAATQGWELISVVSTSPNILIYTFKRDTQQSD